MKRTLTILTIALVGLSACTRTNLDSDQLRQGRQIRFITSPIKTAQTRAGTTPFDENQAFGTTAFSLDKSKTWKDATSGNSTSASISDIASTAITKKKITCESGVWKAWEADESYFWDDFENKSLTFLSWSPYELINNGLSITDAKKFSYTGWTMSATAGYGYSNTNDGSIDLLLAVSPDCTESNSSDGVLTQFVHQLCNVRVLATIMEDPGTARWEVTKVELSNIYTKANLLQAATQTVNTQIWGGHSDAETYTFDTSENPIELKYTSPATEVEIFPKTLMLPQSLFTGSSASSPKITVTCNYIETASSGAKTTTTRTFSGILAPKADDDLSTWLAGKSITYSVGISTKDYPIEFSGSVSDWNSGNSTDVNIGLE